MNRLMVSIQLAAALCAVLIFNMPIASAVQISFFMPGYEPLVTEISDERNVDVNINVFHSSDDSRWENVEISVNVVGTNPAYEVKSILLYSCKNKSPSACMEDDGIKPVEAVNYLSGEKGTFLWEDVSTGSTGNFLTLVQMEYAGKNIWTGYWDRIERLSINEFVNNRKNIESMSVNLKDGVNRDWAINFLTSYFMIPGNWVESITLETVNSEEVSKIHALSGDKENIADDEMQTKIIASNSLSNFENDYLFIFGNGISVPMTVFNGIPSLCGNGYCDSLVNENPDNCCTDCGCEGEKTCTVTDDYQNGMCHVCGDGINDAVENGDTCCSDGGCPAGLVCKKEKNPPYGTCGYPDCGDGKCEGPVENIGTCCIDCGGSEKCANEFGAGFYCNNDLEVCGTPVCGTYGCEPGENAENCCTDCGGSPLCIGEFGGDYYCNQTLGVCAMSSCNGLVCEPGEEHGALAECCNDCDDCPVEGGYQLVCEQNSCHFCGNKKLESPVETESTCCYDSGCASENEYCAESNSCTLKNLITLNVTTSPDEVNCMKTEGAEPITLLVSIKNKPIDFKSLGSFEYTYNGITDSLSCIKKGDAYECQISTTNGDRGIFTGCFDSGEVSFEVNATIKYNRERGYDSETAEITGDARVNIESSLARGCNKINRCESHLGETSLNCCFDCGCESGYYCIEGSCASDSGIALEVDDSTLPSADRIKCSLDEMVDTEYVFTARIINRPDSYDDRLKVKDYGLSYGDTFFDKRDIDLSCEQIKNSDNDFTGEIECSIPLEYFPPCPDEVPETLTLHVNITGGGLEDSYGSGLELSDTFVPSYEHGWQNCGDGDIDDLETSVNCCIDCGCAEGEYCALGVGCTPESEMTMSLSMLPSSSLDCSDTTDKTVSFVAEISPKPVTKRMVGYDDIYLDSDLLKFHRECDFGTLKSVESKYVLQCDFDMERFIPCFTEDDFSFDFSTSVIYKNISKEVREVPLEGTFEFSVTDARERGCQKGGIECDPYSGEIIDLCCIECGCTGGNLCTYQKSCNQTGVSLDITPPSTIDCSEHTTEYLEIDVVNIPYNLKKIEFFSELTIGETTWTNRLSCTKDQTVENRYSCKIKSDEILFCFADVQDESFERNMAIRAEIEYENKALDERLDITARGNAKLVLSRALYSCTNPYTGGEPGCQWTHGETPETCCQDCGCADFGEEGTVYICTSSGCQPKENIGIEIREDSLKADCLIVPTEIYWGDMDSLWEWDSTIKRFTSQSVSEWECRFINAAEFGLDLINEPNNYVIGTVDFYIDGEKQDCANCIIEDGFSDYHDYFFRPKDLSSDATITDRDVMFSVNATITTRDAIGEPEVLHLQSQEVMLTFDTETTDGATDVVNTLEDFKKQMKFFEYVALVAMAIAGICTGCGNNPIENAAATLTIKGGITIIVGTLAAGGIIAAPFLLFDGSWNLWEELLTSYLIGTGVGVAISKIIPYGTIVCTAMLVICKYILYILIGVGALLVYMNSRTDKLVQTAQEYMQNAQIEVGESMESYW